MIALIRIELDDEHLTKQLNDIYERLQDYDNKIMSVPEKIEPPEIYYLWNTDSEYIKGWNDCVDYILGETE